VSVSLPMPAVPPTKTAVLEMVFGVSSALDWRTVVMLGMMERAFNLVYDL
jgi:hypothetical protein